MKNKLEKIIPLILLSAAAIIVVFSIIYVYNFNDYPLTFDDITDNRFCETVYISGDIDDKDGFTEFYKNQTYAEYNGDLGSTTHLKFDFYDIDGNLLFSLTSVGNRNIISVTIDGYESYYMGSMT